MCLAVDTDYYELLNSGERRARQTHQCTECERVIDIGETYSFWTVIQFDDRRVETQRMCAHCHATIKLGVALTGCPESWYWGTVHSLDIEEGFVGNIIHDEGHDLNRAGKLAMLATVRGRRQLWRRKNGELWAVPFVPKREETK